MPLIPNLSLYLIQKFDRLALGGNLTILELHYAETQEKLKMGNVKVQKRKVQFRIRKKNRKKIRDKGHEKKKKRVFTDTEKEVTINTE